MQIANRWLPEGTVGLMLIQGLGGMGKTTLAAEIIHIWHTSFEYVFVFQSKNTALELEEFLCDLDLKLRVNSSKYREMIKKSPNAAIFLPNDGDLNGSKRYDQIFSNIVQVMREEKIFLVFDNFETNLEIEAPQKDYKCKNPQWDTFIFKLSTNLHQTGSRVLITCRRMLTSLVSNNNVLWLPLGPLSIDEIYIFVDDNDAIKKLYSSGLLGQQLVNRLVTISRGHPLVLNHLSAFADRPQRLDEILTQMESKEGWQTLPDLFTSHLTDAERDRERTYLEQAICSSVDTIIQGLSLDARRLLWIFTRSNESVSKELIESIWKHQPEIEVISGAKKENPTINFLLTELEYAGVLHQESEGVYSYQYDVQDRISVWMSNHSTECSDLNEQHIWHDFAIRYEVQYHAVVTSGLTGAMEAADELILRAIRYYILSRDFESLGECASRAVITIINPVTIDCLIQEIQSTLDLIPAGIVRWRILGSLGGLLAKIGDQDRANGLFIQALDEAIKADNWVDIGILSQNWATTFEERGDLTNARIAFSRGREYQIKSNLPPLFIVMSEVECLRIDIYQGKASESWLKIEKRLNKMRNWWQQHRSGQRIPEAPDPVILGHGLVSCLDIAALAKSSMKSYEECLEFNDEMIQVQKDLGESKLQLARSNLNRCQTLIELNRLDEAQPIIEYCLDVFRESETLDFQVQALNALAVLWYKRQDYPKAIVVLQQALAICNGLSNPINRAKFHSNLSLMYRYINREEDNARHMLASIIYNVISAHLQDLARDLQHREIDVKHFNKIQKNSNLPRLKELISLPEFFPLYQYLSQNNVNLDELQSGLDRLEEDVQKDVRIAEKQLK